jgi:NitT/TauT family transport system substrate-binding protein
MIKEIFVSITRGMFLLSVLLLAVQNKSQAASPIEKVTVGTVASVSDAGIYIGIGKGFFKEQGIEIDTPVFDSGSNQVALLAGGKLDVAGGTPAAGLFNAFAQGVNLKVVADKGTHTPGHGYIAFLVRKELSAQVKKVEDLKKLDKPRFSINATGGSGAEAQLRQLLKMAGIDYKTADVKIIPFPQVPAALASNGLDVAPTIEPYATKAIEQGIGTKLLWIDDYRPNDIGGVLMYSEQFIKERPPVARNFMVAYLKALRYYLTAFQGKDAALKNEVTNILTQYTTVKEPELYAKMRVPGFDANGRVNVTSLKNLFADFVAIGYIQNPEKIKVENLVDNSFVDFAAQKLGPFK